MIGWIPVLNNGEDEYTTTPCEGCGESFYKDSAIVIWCPPTNGKEEMYFFCCWGCLKAFVSDGYQCKPRSLEARCGDLQALVESLRDDIRRQDEQIDEDNRERDQLQSKYGKAVHLLENASGSLDLLERNLTDALRHLKAIRRPIGDWFNDAVGKHREPERLD
jgi:hypothetical protein